MEQTFQFENHFNKDNYSIFQTIYTWFDKHTQIRSFSFFPNRHSQNLQFEFVYFTFVEPFRLKRKKSGSVV